MKALYTLLVLCTSLQSFSQSSLENLFGRWEYHDLYKNEVMDSVSIKMLEGFFGDMMMQFNRDKSYQAVVLGRPDQGIWSTKNEKTLHLRSNGGTITPIEIISISENELIFRLERGEFIMKKVHIAEPIEAINTEPPYETVPATRGEIIHKWNLREKDLKQELSEFAEEVTKNIQSSIFIEFYKSGKYESQLLGLREKGGWQFGPGNSSIITDLDGHQQVWNIISISDSELVLIQGNKPQKWYFQVEE